MRSTIRARLAAAAATVGLILGGLGLSAVPAAAADPLVLNAGQDQDVQVLNPFNSVLEVDYETFYLNYDTLFIQNASNQTVSGGIRVNF